MNKKRITTFLLTALLTVATGSYLMANPFAGVTSAMDTIKTVGAAVGAGVGAIFFLWGGSRLGAKLVKGDPDWVQDLLFTIGGAAVGILCASFF